VGTRKKGGPGGNDASRVGWTGGPAEINNARGGRSGMRSSSLKKRKRPRNPVGREGKHQAREKKRAHPPSCKSNDGRESTEVLSKTLKRGEKTVDPGHRNRKQTQKKEINPWGGKKKVLPIHQPVSAQKPVGGAQT